MILSLATWPLRWIDWDNDTLAASGGFFVAGKLGLDKLLVIVYTGGTSNQKGENMNSGHGGKRVPGPGKKLGPPFKSERYVKQHISLPPQQFAWLKEYSENTGIPMSRIIQVAIEEYKGQLEQTRTESEPKIDDEF